MEKRLLWVRNGLLAFNVLRALALTVFQWRAWMGSALSKILLTLPLDAATPFPEWLAFLRPLFAHGGGYFAFYIIGRFWLPVVALFATTALLYLSFVLLARIRPGAQSVLDVRAAVVGALASGWPGVILFIPLTFFIAVVHGVVNHFARRPHLSLLFSSALAFLIVLFGGPTLIPLLHLTVLKF